MSCKVPTPMSSLASLEKVFGELRPIGEFIYFLFGPPLEIKFSQVTIYEVGVLLLLTGVSCVAIVRRLWIT